MYENAEKNGMTNCLEMVGKVSDFIEGGRITSHSVTSGENPEYISVVTAEEFSDATVLTSSVVIENKTDECYMEYTKVIFKNISCVSEIAKHYKDAEYAGELGDKVAVLEDEAVDIYLLPIEDGCITVRKERSWTDSKSKTK